MRGPGHQINAHFSLILLLLFLLTSVAYADDAPNLARIHQLIAERDYDRALALASELARLDKCDRDCRAECHLLSGFCRFMMSQESAARHELEQAIRIKPKYRIDEAEYPDRFKALFEQARRHTVCSLEIRVTSRQSLALMADENVSLVYRADDIPAGWISLSDNKYGRPQRYQLSAGRMNYFDLKLEELHDYWSFDSLNILFRPALKTPTGDIKPLSNREKSQIGKYIYDLSPEHYKGQPVSRISVGDSLNQVSWLVFESKPAWKRLHRDLASNHSRRLLTRVARWTSIVGATVTGIWAVSSHIKAVDRYDEYMLETDRVRIASLYRDYEGLVQTRNITGGLSIVMAAVAVGSFIFAPGDERDLIDEYERNYGPSGITFEVGQDGVGLKLKLGV